MKDYVIYGDTDSVYININDFIIDYIDDPKKWEILSQEKQIDIIKRISKEVENFVNDKVRNKVQKEIYNSTEEDFVITYEQEKIASSGLFIKKKKYATHTVVEDGMPKDKISITGLEIIRSDTPLIFKEGLKVILEMLLKGAPDSDIVKTSKEYITKAKKLEPQELSSNIGINGMSKYINDDLSCKKGTPWHVKGAANYKKLLTFLKIQNQYPQLEEGVKAKVIYVKQNPYGIDCISYQIWPKEFNKCGVTPDLEKMIEKFFITKVDYLLSPMGKEGIITKTNENLKLFF